MADVVIVTKSSYFNGKRVNHIVFFEEEAGNGYSMDPFGAFNQSNIATPRTPRKARAIGKKMKGLTAAQKARIRARAKKAKKEAKVVEPPKPKMNYVIDINYNDITDNIQQTRITFSNKKAAMDEYKKIIVQIRDQHPDKPLVDRLANEYLLGITDDEK